MLGEQLLLPFSLENALNVTQQFHLLIHYYIEYQSFVCFLSGCFFLLKVVNQKAFYNSTLFYEKNTLSIHNSHLATVKISASLKY